jgi:hypothetical protein
MYSASPIEVKEEFSILSALEIPNQERLLPIGASRETVSNLAEKMRSCLHLADPPQPSRESQTDFPFFRFL